MQNNQLVPYGRYAIPPWVIPAAAATREITRGAMRYFTSRPPQTRRANPVTPPQPQVAPTQGTSRKNRRRRNRSRRNPSSGAMGLTNQMSSMSLTPTLRLRDSEILYSVKKTDKAKVFYFNPLPSDLTRAAKIVALYQQFKINSIKVNFKSGVGSTESGTVAMAVYAGVASDTTIAKVKEVTDVLKLTPHVALAQYKNGSLNIGRGIDRTKWMVVNSKEDSGVAFTLFVQTNNSKDVGLIEVNYDILLRYPDPF